MIIKGIEIKRKRKILLFVSPTQLNSDVLLSINIVFHSSLFVFLPVSILRNLRLPYLYICVSLISLKQSHTTIGLPPKTTIIIRLRKYMKKYKSKTIPQWILHWLCNRNGYDFDKRFFVRFLFYKIFLKFVFCSYMFVQYEF